MSMHKVPLTPTEEAGLLAHGLQRSIGQPSQLADVFRQGVAWGIKAGREGYDAALADACMEAEIPDSKYESLLIALQRQARAADNNQGPT